MFLALALIAGGPGGAVAQEGDPPPRGAINGLALDSTTMAPLAGAVISVAGGGGALVADADGRFRFEDVPFGSYPLVVDHPRLDSLGLTPILRTVQIAPGAEVEVVFATPSLTSLRSMYCGSAPGRGDRNGILIGAVQDEVTTVGQPGASVVAEWLEPDGERAASAVTADGSGVFTICDLPRNVPVRMLVYLYGDTRDETVVNLDGRGILLQDLTVRLTEPATMLGEVIDQDTGEPIEAAVVRIRGTDLEAVTNGRGRFRFEEVPPGRQILDMEHLAYGTQSREIDVGTMTLDVTARFSRTAIEVEGITVVAHPARLERMGYFQRRQMRAGFASFIERDEIVARSPIRLSSALASEPGVVVRHGIGGPYLVTSRGGRGISQADCRLRMIVDGMEMSGPGWNLDSFPPDQVQAIEVYPTELSLPQRFRNFGPGMTTCGAVVIWTGR
jgi:hypothetical protein